VIVVFVMATTVPIMARQQLGFDEGWNLQAPYELAAHGTYASFGSVFDGQTKIFDPYLSTGPAVSFPIAAAFKVFSVGVLQARWVMLLFYLAALILLAWYVYERTRSLYALIAPLTLLLLSSSGLAFRIEILGEMAGVAYALGSLLAWRHHKYALAGLLAALAMLSKFLLLLLVVAGFMALFIRLVRHWQTPKTVLQQAGWWTLGTGAPLFLWEVFRFIQLGGSRHAYIQNLREFGHFFKANGSGIGSTGTSGLTIPHKFHMLTSNIAVSNRLMIIAGIIIASGLVLGYRKLYAVARENVFGLLFIALYAVWWFLFSNGGYARYTLPLFVVGYAILLYTFLRVQPAEPPRLRVLSHGLKVVLVLVLVAALHTFYVPFHLPTYTITLDTQQRIANRVVQAHPARLTHVGWWQNPEILFLTKMHSTEFDYIKIGQSYDLLLAPALRDIVPTEYVKFQSLCTNVVFTDNGYILCTGTKLAERER